jgi:CubicO group peptidase (beta-lactamase class C family)
MTMGLAWDESLSYADPRNAERQMSDADDRVAFVLGKPATEPPGRHWHYCGGATELLAAVITQASGKSLEEFAAQRLFTPLGLRNIEWMGDTKGPYAASGLRMTLPNLARIGQLILKDGRWDGAELIPSAWLRVALSPYVNMQTISTMATTSTAERHRSQRAPCTSARGSATVVNACPCCRRSTPSS